MVKLLRVIKTSPAYRRVRGLPRAKDPDDVWHGDDASWLISFAVDAGESEAIALFVVDHGSGMESATLGKAMMVRQGVNGVVADVL